MTTVICRCGWEVEIADGTNARRCAVCQTLVTRPIDNPEIIADAALADEDAADEVLDAELDSTNEEEAAESESADEHKPRKRRRKMRPRKRTWLSKFEGLQVPTGVDLVGSLALFTIGGVIIAFRLAHGGVFSFIGLAILLLGFVRLYMLASLNKN